MKGSYFSSKDFTGDRTNMEDLSDEQIEGKTVEILLLVYVINKMLVSPKLSRFLMIFLILFIKRIQSLV